ncbi:unnamed protein product [Trichogramma brassicae]|uniref:Uncharacterized protein n=1 Tax=Trichogramma brassicae TaxID=86971 RepID=A0A6H5IKF3_9HYME|nr:unnamed protein product [Trichogramma brassicae]
MARAARDKLDRQYSHTAPHRSYFWRRARWSRQIAYVGYSPWSTLRIIQEMPDGKSCSSIPTADCPRPTHFYASVTQITFDSDYRRDRPGQADHIRPEIISARLRRTPVLALFQIHFPLA